MEWDSTSGASRTRKSSANLASRCWLRRLNTEALAGTVIDFVEIKLGPIRFVLYRTGSLGPQDASSG
jgi:hypothetical protein